MAQFNLPTGGRLKYFSANWSAITSDPWILSTISKGVVIDFVQNPVQRTWPPSIKMSEAMRAVCDQEIIDLQAKGAVVEIVDNSPGVYSAFFAIPKSTGDFRPIINLKPVNAFIVYQHFKMESFETA